MSTGLFQAQRRPITVDGDLGDRRKAEGRRQRRNNVATKVTGKRSLGYASQNIVPPINDPSVAARFLSSSAWLRTKSRTMSAILAGARA
jgi:hypothetical protein